MSTKTGKEWQDDRRNRDKGLQYFIHSISLYTVSKIICYKEGSENVNVFNLFKREKKRKDNNVDHQTKHA